MGIFTLTVTISRALPPFTCFSERTATRSLTTAKRVERWRPAEEKPMIP